LLYSSVVSARTWTPSSRPHGPGCPPFPAPARILFVLTANLIENLRRGEL